MSLTFTQDCENARQGAPYGDAIFALPEAFFFGHSGTIFERPRSLSIDYSGAKYTRFPPKIVAAQKALF